MERTAVLAGPGQDCRWAAITEDMDRCEAIADWVLSGPPTLKLCSTHMVAKCGMGLVGVSISAPPTAVTRGFVSALRRLADAIEAADAAAKRRT